MLDSGEEARECYIKQYLGTFIVEITYIYVVAARWGLHLRSDAVTAVQSEKLQNLTKIEFFGQNRG